MKYLAVLFLLFSFSFSNAQYQFTGNLKQDSRIIQSDYNSPVNQYSFQMQNKKSPMLAGLLSLVLPGAGEFYTGEYIKGAIFLAVEAAVVTTAIIYDKKGDDQTGLFQNYADERWSVVRYAEWINEYQNGNIYIDPDASKPPWERVNWAELNANEHGSHTLPPHGDQQYYELIGKYYQYSGGWDDYNSGPNNPEMSPNFLFYSGMRGQANDYYNVASKAVIGIYINHFLSMLDAVWSAVQFNNNLAFNIRVEENYLTRETDFIPYLNVRMNF
jgi:hypothetical protein